LPRFYALTDRPAEAAALAERQVQRRPKSQGARTDAGVVALLTGNYEAAAQHLERARDLQRRPIAAPSYGSQGLFLDHTTLLGYALLKLGQEERALRLFEETEQYYQDRIAKGDTSYQARVGIAAVHALRGDREAAYDWLQKAVDAGFYAYTELGRHPSFESLHGEERFQRMMEGVKARVGEMRRQVDAMEAGG
jgi:tetratricopeptide (TPR) repeat protein